MTNPLVVFADPEKVIRDRLVAGYSGRLETYLPTAEHIDVKFPPPDLDGGYVQIAHEFSPADDYPAKERAQVRVVCWMPAKRRSDVKDLATLTMALLNATPGGADLTIIRPLGGRSAVITDPDTQYLVCWFLVRVNLRPNQLAS